MLATAKTQIKPAKWKLLLAFAAIYFVWGSTFLAIRIGVQEVPPLTLAALRFGIAGSALFGWALIKGERQPFVNEWRSIVLLAILIFVIDYGLLFWAEVRVPSGLAAVMTANIPTCIAVGEVAFLRTQRMTFRLALALGIGIIGVGILMSRSRFLEGTPVDTAGAIALMIASVSFAAGSILNRRFTMPISKIMSSGAQMLVGGIFLTLAAIPFGEFDRLHLANVSARAWLALLYLIIAGSIIAFTAYLWLLHHESPTKVATYAYVNPVVAVFVGYFAGGETLDARTVLGTVVVLGSVLIITTMPPTPTLQAVDNFRRAASEKEESQSS
jgi:drug/metabolite transporter (DMT)-like permease